MPDLVVRAERVWVDGAFRPAQVQVSGGVITAVLPFDAECADPVTLARRRGPPARSGRLARARQRAGPHRVGGVRVRDPGRGGGWRHDHRRHALNSIPPTTTVEALAAKRDATDGKLTVDVAFWGGAVPANLGSLEALHDAGVRGFKAFLAPRGSTSSSTSPSPPGAGARGDRLDRQRADRARGGPVAPAARRTGARTATSSPSRRR